MHVSWNSQRLFRYLVARHWNGRLLTGPDPGVRFNARIGRFAKSYLRFYPWSDDLAYMQAQGYWIEDCLEMHELFGGRDGTRRGGASWMVAARRRRDTSHFACA